MSRQSRTEQETSLHLTELINCMKTPLKMKRFTNSNTSLMSWWLEVGTQYQDGVSSLLFWTKSVLWLCF